MIACWILLTKPEILEEFYFKETLFDPEQFDRGRVTNLLPITPSDMLQAYDFGVICEKIDQAQLKNNQTGILYLIDQIKSMAGRDDVTIDQVSDIRNQVDLYVN